MNRCPLNIGGVMGPMTSMPHISNGHKEDVRWRCPGAWWM